MITEIDDIRTKNTFDMIDASSLEPKTKAELKESVEEAKLNLNGRTLEERCASIARNQFDVVRFIVEVLVKFKSISVQQPQPERTWKDVLVETQWGWVVLGVSIAVCTIFQPQIVEVLKAVVSVVR